MWTVPIEGLENIQLSNKPPWTPVSLYATLSRRIQLQKLKADLFSPMRTLGLYQRPSTNRSFTLSTHEPIHSVLIWILRCLFFGRTSRATKTSSRPRITQSTVSLFHNAPNTRSYSMLRNTGCKTMDALQNYMDYVSKVRTCANAHTKTYLDDSSNALVRCMAWHYHYGHLAKFSNIIRSGQ